MRVNHWPWTINFHQITSFHKCINPAALSREKNTSSSLSNAAVPLRSKMDRGDKVRWVHIASVCCGSAAFCRPSFLFSLSCNDKTADVTFRWIDWNDDKYTGCSVMVLINTNHLFWWRLTHLFGARTSGNGEKGNARLKSNGLHCLFPLLHRKHSGMVQEQAFPSPHIPSRHE